MRITEYKDGKLAEKILVACATNRTVLAAVSERWDRNGLFDSRAADIIASWCVDYYKKYRKSPRSHLEPIYDEWVGKTRDKDLAKMVGDLMKQLSDSYRRGKKPTSEDFTIDLAGKLFKKAQVRKHLRELSGLLETDEVDKAVEKINKFTPVEMGAGAFVDVMAGDENLRKAYQRESEEPLVRYPGALGEFINKAMHRGRFVAFEGPEKRGKSFWLGDVAWRAATQGKKTAFFAVGDMDQDEMLVRFGSRASGRPTEETEFDYPVALTPPSGGSPYATSSPEKKTKPIITFAAARQALRKAAKKVGDDKVFRLSTHANDSISVNGISAILQGWARTGWVADVVVIDYADLLSPIDSKAESRDQINLTWKRLKRISQEFHCLVVSASQTDADSYAAETIGMKNFSGDKRKNAHVNGMIGLNQTEEEKDQGIMRLNWVVLRKGKFLGTKCVHVAGCLAVANPAILSTF